MSTDAPGWDPRLAPLLKRTAEIRDLNAALAVLGWDQQVFMPSGAAAGRASQLETLTVVVHEKSTDPAYGDLIREAAAMGFDPDSDEAALIRRLERDYRKKQAVPADLAGRLARQSGETQAAWEKAYAAADFKLCSDELKKLLALEREYADCFPEAGSRYDAMLDDYEEGLTSATLDAIVPPLKDGLESLLAEIMARPAPEDAFLYRDYDTDAQLAFCRRLTEAMGFDYTHGRLDLSTHPFTTDFGLDDVRITTRVRRNEPANCIFSCIHECGHAMYQQGISPKYAGTPLSDGASLAFHESQSRFWENILGRSAEFWRNFYPDLVKTFPDNLRDVPLESFLAAVNRVRPSFIRTESDEVTYNLHIILRVELERALIEDRLPVDDLPAAWNDAFERSFGIRPANDREGVLQDVHWYSGGVGYFPTYMLGNLIGAELKERLFPSGLPETPREALAVLRENIYRFGAKYAPADFLRRLTGHAVPDAAPFLRYLRAKHLGEK